MYIYTYIYIYIYIYIYSYIYMQEKYSAKKESSFLYIYFWQTIATLVMICEDVARFLAFIMLIIEN